MSSEAVGQGSTGQMVDLGRYGRAARRRWPEILLLAVLGGAGGYFLLPSVVYESSAVIQVRPGLVEVGVTGQPTGPNMSTELQVAKSESVVAQALTDVPGGLSVSQFQPRGTVSSPPDSTTMTFTFTAPQASEAQQGAEAWATAYLDSRERDLETRLAGAISQSEDQVAALQRQRLAGIAAVEDAPAGSVEEAQAKADLRLKNNQLRIAENRVASLKRVVVDAGNIISNPLRPQVPSGLTPLMAAILGALTGAVLGVVFAILSERLSRRVRDERDLARGTEAPVWAVLRPDEDTLRAYEAVAARLLLGVRRRGLQSVLVTAPERSAEEEVLALAAAIEMLGHETEVTVDMEGLLADAGSHPLAAPGNPSGRLLLVSAPAIRDDPRTAVLAAEAGAVLLVATARSTKVRDVRDASELLAENGSRIDGVLLTHRRPAHRGGQGAERKPTDGAAIESSQSGSGKPAARHAHSEPADGERPPSAGEDAEVRQSGAGPEETSGSSRDTGSGPGAEQTANAS